MATQATATTELRWVERHLSTGGSVWVLQRRFLAVENTGQHNERSYYVWLDVPTVIELDAERNRRVEVENEIAIGQCILQWPTPKLFG